MPLLTILIFFSCNTDQKKSNTPSKDRKISLSDNSLPPASYPYISAQVRGDHNDLIYFLKNTNDGMRIIGIDRIRNGDELHTSYHSFDQSWNGHSWLTYWDANDPINVKKQQVDSIFYFSVRHGELRDLVYFYAAIGDTVYRSREWGDYGAGNTNKGVAVTHDKSTLKIQGFPFNDDEGKDGVPTASSSYGYIQFIPNTKKFRYEFGNGANFSTNENTQERILLRD